MNQKNKNFKVLALIGLITFTQPAYSISTWLSALYCGAGKAINTALSLVKEYPKASQAIAGFSFFGSLCCLIAWKASKQFKAHQQKIEEKKHKQHKLKLEASELAQEVSQLKNKYAQLSQKSCKKNELLEKAKNARKSKKEILAQLKQQNLTLQKEIDDKKNHEEAAYTQTKTINSLNFYQINKKQSHFIFIMNSPSEIIIDLFKKDTCRSIGTAIIKIKEGHLRKVKKAELSLLHITDEQSRKKGLGNYLLKYAIKTIIKFFNPKEITWLAEPFENKNATREDLLRLVGFYCKCGAIQGKQNLIASCEMSYPIRSAHMLATLLPILEPRPVPKSEKRITLANGTEYQTNPHDPLGIIANYMGQTNHLDQ